MHLDFLLCPLCRQPWHRCPPARALGLSTKSSCNAHQFSIPLATPQMLACCCAFCLFLHMSSHQQRHKEEEGQSMSSMPLGFLSITFWILYSDISYIYLYFFHYVLSLSLYIYINIIFSMILSNHFYIIIFSIIVSVPLGGLAMAWQGSLHWRWLDDQLAHHDSWSIQVYIILYFDVL